MSESVRIADVRIGRRYRRDMGDLSGLADSIKRVGLLHPIVVTAGDVLVAGERRLRACESLGWTRIPCRVVPDLDDLLRAESDENTVRQNFTPSEAHDIYEALLVREREAAKERQGTRTDLAPALGAKLAPSQPKPMESKSSTRAAAATGYSRQTLAKVAEVKAAADAGTVPQSVVQEMDTTGRVDGAYRKVQRAKAAAVIRSEPAPLPAGPFRVIVADPPWRYDGRADDLSHRSANPYPDMSTPEIMAMPVRDMAHDDAILWLWTTNAFMEHAFGIAREWGFEPRTILTWAKDRMGTGDWLRGQTEHCLLAVRGKPTVLLTNQTTLLRAPLREHSRKPDEFYALVEALCPGSKVELFAREARPGWALWGAEAPEAAA